ncbi:FAD:protein FMN transferase [Caenispirillum bisanense]|uniref:FAD:protein FMN transferase n=1 Tax=Caenispirillum bisanense TaxID=414052 RepID=A0A286GWX4_9PROT|nr:FAD:protein FMN transferase [Caenispirillum bisanense]SOD99554.1 thiamine biosynthesis lipoprotein [Caenispirillum bisanense]
MTLSRRRFVAIAAGAGAAAVLAGTVPAAAAPGLRRWKGVALGAAAEMILPADAMDLLPAVQAEIARLEAIFSLYRPDSALVRLNAAGVLEAPPLELVEVLGRARALSALTDGAFDVTVQPLWALHARAADPTLADLAAARALVDWRGVSVEADRIALARPGMAITLNGIAQGYVTDRVAALLRREGLTEVLVALGETRALGGHPAGRPWQVAPAAGAEALPLVDAALATTEPAGHVFDPATGRPGGTVARITVQAPTAVVADAVSTALALLPADRRAAVAEAAGATRVW